MTETEQVLARVICKDHSRIIGHVYDRDGQLVFVHRPYRRDYKYVSEYLTGTEQEPWPLDAPYAMAFLRCSRCRKNRMVPGSKLVVAARSKGTATRVLV
jgi:hypothetical protein